MSRSETAPANEIHHDPLSGTIRLRGRLRESSKHIFVRHRIVVPPETMIEIASACRRKGQAHSAIPDHITGTSDEPDPRQLAHDRHRRTFAAAIVGDEIGQRSSRRLLDAKRITISFKRYFALVVTGKQDGDLEEGRMVCLLLAQEMLSH